MKHFKEITKDSNIYDILIDYVEFFMYSVPEVIYEEVRTILIEKGLDLLKYHQKEYIKPRLYRVLTNIKITEMRKYYANKKKYKQNYYEDGVTLPYYTEVELDTRDNKLKFKEQLEVLYTAVRRMKPTQKRLIRMFFKIHNQRKNYYERSNFKVPINHVISKTGINKRRGYQLLSEIRGILKQVILERRENINDFSSVRITNFEELWKNIKGGNIL